MNLTSKEKYLKNNIVDKRNIWYSVNKKLKNKISKNHTFSVINLLIEEMISAMLNDHELKIKNFASFKIKKMKAKQFISICDGEIHFSAGNRSLKIVLDKKISKLLTKNIK